MGRHNKSEKQPGTETQQLRPIPGSGEYVPMEYRGRRLWNNLVGALTLSAVVALVILVSVLLVGCSSLDAGKIVEKDHDPAYTTTICQGKPVICTPHFHPEKWEFKVKADGETGWVRVSKHEYNKYKVGDWYP